MIVGFKKMSVACSLHEDEEFLFKMVGSAFAHAVFGAQTVGFTQDYELYIQTDINTWTRQAVLEQWGLEHKEDKIVIPNRLLPEDIKKYLIRRSAKNLSKVFDAVTKPTSSGFLICANIPKEYKNDVRIFMSMLSIDTKKLVETIPSTGRYKGKEVLRLMDDEGTNALIRLSP